MIASAPPIPPVDIAVAYLGPKVWMVLTTLWLANTIADTVGRLRRWRRERHLHG